MPHPWTDENHPLSCPTLERFKEGRTDPSGLPSLKVVKGQSCCTVTKPVLFTRSMHQDNAGGLSAVVPIPDPLAFVVYHASMVIYNDG
jgi:hypothetical protein